MFGRARKVAGKACSVTSHDTKTPRERHQERRPRRPRRPIAAQRGSLHTGESYLSGHRCGTLLLLRCMRWWGRCSGGGGDNTLAFSTCRAEEGDGGEAAAASAAIEAIYSHRHMCYRSQTCCKTSSIQSSSREKDCSNNIH